MTSVPLIIPPSNKTKGIFKKQTNNIQKRTSNFLLPVSSFSCVYFFSIFCWHGTSLRAVTLLKMSGIGHRRPTDQLWSKKFKKIKIKKNVIPKSKETYRRTVDVYGRWPVSGEERCLALLSASRDIALGFIWYSVRFHHFGWKQRAISRRLLVGPAA